MRTAQLAQTVGPLASATTIGVVRLTQSFLQTGSPRNRELPADDRRGERIFANRCQAIAGSRRADQLHKAMGKKTFGGGENRIIGRHKGPAEKGQRFG